MLILSNKPICTKISKMLSLSSLLELELNPLNIPNKIETDVIITGIALI